MVFNAVFRCTQCVIMTDFISDALQTDSSFIMANCTIASLTAITVVTDTVRIVVQVLNMSKKRLLLYITNKAQRRDTVSIVSI